MPQPKLRVVRRAAEELSDTEVERLVDFGRREANLIDEMVAAARIGDRVLVLQIVEALVAIEDQLHGEPYARIVTP